MTTRILTAALLLAATLVSCSSPTDLQPSLAIVYGLISGDDGQSIADAEVTIRAFIDTCDSNNELSTARVRSNSSGAYRALMAGPHVESISTCLVVNAAPVQPSEYQEATATGAVVRFVHEAFTPPIDSVRVDVTVAVTHNP